MSANEGDTPGRRRTTTTTPPPDRQEDEAPAPIIIDVGARTKREINNLKDGRGRLLDEVDMTVSQVRAQLGLEDAGREYVPVFIIVKQKRRRVRRVSMPMMPFPFF